MNYNLLNLIIGIISIITTIGGIGGSCFYIPLFCIVEKKSIEDAIPITLVTLFGDALIRFLFLINKKHPLCSNRYLINIHLVTLLSIYDSNLSFLGIFINEYLTSKIKKILLTTILCVTLIRSIIHSFNIFHNSRREDQNTILINIDGISFHIKQNTNSIEYSPDSKKEYIKSIIILIVILLVVNLFVYLQKKIKQYYTFVLILQMLFAYVIGTKISKHMIVTYENKKNNNFVFLPDDMIWNQTNVVKLIAIGSICGLVSTSFGIGGSMILLPIIIHTGVSPYVAIACTSVTSFISSISSCYNYAINNRIDYQYSIPLAISSGIGSYIGLLITKKCKLFKKQYILSSLICILLLISIVLINI